MKNTLITLLLIGYTCFGYAQDLNFREDLNLAGFNYKIYTKQEKSKMREQTAYVIPNQTDTIFHEALVKDLKTNNEIYRGIYRHNEQELHFIKFDLAQNKMNHKVYAPNKEGRLILIKESTNLEAYPEDLPPKFKDNKPIHPTYPNGQVALYKWVEHNLYPILEQKHKKSLKGNAVLLLEVDSNGSATLAEIKNLATTAEIRKKLEDKLAQMPKWETKIQGYNVSGVVFIPIHF